MVFVCRDDHALARRKRLQLGDLAKEERARFTSCRRVSPMSRICSPTVWAPRSCPRRRRCAHSPRARCPPSPGAWPVNSAARITVKNLQPGPIDTDLNPDEGDFAGALKRLSAQGRYGHTGAFAALVSFLAGLEAGYVTGANINVDGGITD